MQYEQTRKYDLTKWTQFTFDKDERGREQEKAKVNAFIMDVLNETNFIVCNGMNLMNVKAVRANMYLEPLEGEPIENDDSEGTMVCYLDLSFINQHGEEIASVSKGTESAAYAPTLVIEFDTGAMASIKVKYGE